MPTVKFDAADAQLRFSMSKALDEMAQEAAEQVVPLVLSGRGDGGSIVITSRSSSGGPSKQQTGTVIRRMRDRRRRDDDDDDRKRGGRKPGGDDYERIKPFRRRAMLAYAYDVTTGDYYVGYSGGASAVYSGQLHGSGVNRRRDRVHPYLRDTRQRTDFHPLNCAEVAALNVALSYGANVGNLFFISLDSDGNLRNPCANCQQWITQYARGYLHV